jgi:hypothetical protein
MKVTAHRTTGNLCSKKYFKRRKTLLTTVVYQNGNCGLVSTDHLDDLISASKIKAFLRLEGLAIIGRDPIRVAAQGYHRHERRKQSLVSLDNYLDKILDFLKIFSYKEITKTVKEP